MEEEILKEIMKECKWWEKIIIKLFKKNFIKISNITRIIVANSIIKC